jgi:hypothetical protein
MITLKCENMSLLQLFKICITEESKKEKYMGAHILVVFNRTFLII